MVSLLDPVTPNTTNCCHRKTCCCSPLFYSRRLLPADCTSLCLAMSSPNPSSTLSPPGTPRRSNVKYVSAAALNLERVYEQNRARLQQRDGALSPTSEQATANAGKGKPRLLLMGQRRYVLHQQDLANDGQMHADEWRTGVENLLYRVLYSTKYHLARHCSWSPLLGFKRTLWRKWLKSAIFSSK